MSRIATHGRSGASSAALLLLSAALVLFGDTGLVAGAASDLQVYLAGPSPRLIQVPFKPTSMTAGGLIQTVADELGVAADYVALFMRPTRVVDGSRRVIAPTRYSLRIGATSSWPNATEVNAKSLRELGIRAGSPIDCSLRPLRGDHIHYAVAFYVNDELVEPVYDQGWVGPSFADEGMQYPTTFSNLSENLGNIHITQLNPHFGLHAGMPEWTGYGFAHVHPGTAWTWLHATEGLGATLDQFLEMVHVGIWDSASTRYSFGSYHVPSAAPFDGAPQSVLTFPASNKLGQVQMVGGEYDCKGLDTTEGVSGRTIGPGKHPLSDYQNIKYSDLDFNANEVLIASNATHVWRTYYYSYWEQEEPEVLESGAGSLWLVENLGMIVMSYEPRARPPGRPRPPSCMVDMMIRPQQRNSTGDSWENYYYTLGFDGYPYPMPNAKQYNYSNSMGYELSSSLQWLYNSPQQDRDMYAGLEEP